MCDKAEQHTIGDGRSRLPAILFYRSNPQMYSKTTKKQNRLVCFIFFGYF